MAVLFARGLRELPQVQDWIVAYPGTTPLPEVAPVGIPAWLAWTHFLNAFFIVLIIKSGWAVRTVEASRRRSGRASCSCAPARSRSA